MKCPSFSTEYHAAPRERRTSDSSVCLRQVRVRKLNLAAACSSASVFLKREKSCEARMLARPGMLVAVTSGPPSLHSYIHASVSNTKLTSQLRRSCTLRIVLGTVLVRRNNIYGKYFTSAWIEHLIANLWMGWVHVLSDTVRAGSISSQSVDPTGNTATPS